MGKASAALSEVIVLCPEGPRQFLLHFMGKQGDMGGESRNRYSYGFLLSVFTTIGMALWEQVNVQAGGKASRMRPKGYPPKVRRREKTRAENRNVGVDCTTNS